MSIYFLGLEMNPEEFAKLIIRYQGLGSLTHRGIVLDDIVGDINGALLNIFLQKNTP